MLKNYFKIAWRNLSKYKIYSVINVIGLAVGLACVLVIVSYVKFETGFDEFHEDADEIYRMTLNWENDAQRVNSAMVHSPVADILRQNATGIDEVVRIYPHFKSMYVGADNQNLIKAERFLFADSTFFDVFDFRIVQGEKRPDFSRPFSLAISENKAMEIYGTTDVVGEKLIYKEDAASFEFYITAVLADSPENSHFKFDYLASFGSLTQVFPHYDNWHHPPMYLYFKSPRTNIDEGFVTDLNEIIAEHQPTYVKDEKRTYDVQPLLDIHLHSSMEDEWEANSDYAYVKLFLIIAGFILLIACLNFMNLTTARSVQRAKEVGMRKAMGAQKSQLIIQFFGESLLVTLIAFFIGIASAELILKNVFNSFMDYDLSLNYLTQWPYFPMLVASIVIIGCISGIYPAFYLSRFRPHEILKGRASSGVGNLNLRRGMVVFQFSVSCLLILGTSLVMKQTDYLRNKDLGFDHKHIVTVKMVDRYSQKNSHVFKTNLLRESAVSDVSISSTLPGKQDYYGLDIHPESKSDQKLTMKSLGVDEDFISTYGLEIVEGQSFKSLISNENQHHFILNEAAIEALQWESPMGKEFGITVYTGREEVRMGRVVGVVKNFNFRSLYNEVEPLILYINKHPYYTDYASVKFDGGNPKKSMELLEKHWKEFNPEKPLEFEFLDEQLDEMYHSEIRRSRIFTAFAVLSIIISCLGLFGLSSFSAQQRIKEIGIRKVLGANVSGILLLLSKEYLVLIVLANIIAWPIAFWKGSQWLDTFAYQVKIEPGLFMDTLIIALSIGILTVGFQSIKAAVSNPIESLRTE